MDVGTMKQVLANKLASQYSGAIRSSLNYMGPDCTGLATFIRLDQTGEMSHINIFTDFWCCHSRVQCPQ